MFPPIFATAKLAYERREDIGKWIESSPAEIWKGLKYVILGKDNPWKKYTSKSKSVLPFTQPLSEEIGDVEMPSTPMPSKIASPKRSMTC